MKNEGKSKEVTYTVKGGDKLEVSRKVEHKNRPRISLDWETMFMILTFGTLWFLLILMFVGLR